MKRGSRRRREWFWRSRANGAPAAYVERSEDGRWRIFIGHREIASVASREVAIALVDELDATDRGRHHR